MRLKDSIFLWGLPAAVIPLALLGFIATSWSEEVYLRDADRELNANLESVVVAIQRRLRIERDLVNGLSLSPAVQQFLPVIEALRNGEVHPQATARFERANHFIETFQSVRVSLGTVRILDHEGNSLIKVSGGHRSSLAFEGLGALPYVEDESDDPDLASILDELPADGVGSLLLSGNRVIPGIGTLMPIYNTAAPLLRNGERIAHLTINPPLLQLNRILEIAPSVHRSTLLIAEVDSGNAARDGLVLFDGQHGIDLLSVKSDAPRLQTIQPQIHSAVFAQEEGLIEADDSGMRTYYQAFLPYPDRLLTWVAALQVEPQTLSAPFHNIRIAILISVLAALALGLLLAGAAARQIARPALRLTQGLSDFATGRRGHRLEPEGPDELQIAGRAFNEMADTLELAEQERDQAMAAQFRSRRLASVGQMAAGIAHEINNPINTILSLTTLLDRELPPDAEDSRSDVQSIREETERVAETVRAILNFSREIHAESGRFEVAQWVRDSVALAAQEHRTGDVAVEIEVCKDGQINGDRRLLQRVLLNLLENAAQASPPDKPVRLVVDRDDESIVVEVLDAGPGLGEEQLDRAFDPFYTTKPEGVGSGLGLSLSLGIVHYHGGTLSLNNRSQGGTCARLQLPIDQDQANAAAEKRP